MGIDGKPATEAIRVLVRRGGPQSAGTKAGGLLPLGGIAPIPELAVWGHPPFGDTYLPFRLGTPTFAAVWGHLPSPTFAVPFRDTDLRRPSPVWGHLPFRVFARLGTPTFSRFRRIDSRVLQCEAGRSVQFLVGKPLRKREGVRTFQSTCHSLRRSLDEVAGVLRLPLWRPRRWCRQRIAGREFRKQREVAVTREQDIDAVRNANGRDSRIVYDSSDHVRPTYESLQGLIEILCFSDHPVGGRCVPGMELQPGLFRRCGVVFPDAAICHHAQELVAARPGNRPGSVALGKIRQEGMCRLAESRFAAVGVDEDIGVDRDHRVPGSP